MIERHGEKMSSLAASGLIYYRDLNSLSLVSVRSHKFCWPSLSQFFIWVILGSNKKYRSVSVSVLTIFAVNTIGNYFVKTVERYYHIPVRLDTQCT